MRMHETKAAGVIEDLRRRLDGTITVTLKPTCTQVLSYRFVEALARAEHAERSGGEAPKPVPIYVAPKVQGQPFSIPERVILEGEEPVFPPKLDLAAGLKSCPHHVSKYSP